MQDEPALSDPREAKLPTWYMQMMDVDNQSQRKGMGSAVRIILGIAIAVVGIYLAVWFLNSFAFYAFLAVPIIAGFIAGYFLKKHFFWALSWALLIPIGYLIDPQLFWGPGPNEYVEFDFAGFFWFVIVLPIYPSAFFGFLTSLGVSAWRARSQ